MRYLWTAFFVTIGWGFWSIYDGRKEAAFAAAACVLYIMMGVGLYLGTTGVPNVGFPLFWGAWALYVLMGIRCIVKLDPTFETTHPDMASFRR